jgi:hypothetical protein
MREQPGIHTNGKEFFTLSLIHFLEFNSFISQIYWTWTQLDSHSSIHVEILLEFVDSLYTNIYFFEHLLIHRLQLLTFSSLYGCT